MLKLIMLKYLFLLLFLGCFSAFPKKPFQDTAEQVVKSSFKDLYKNHDLNNFPLYIDWHEELCPHPDIDGESKTAVIYDNKCYAGLAFDWYCSVAWRGNYSNSAFSHEIQHLLMRNLLGLYDPYHQIKEFWDRVINTNIELMKMGL